MAVYRFRILFEDNEDLVREIDVLGKQSYEDLHRAIQEAIGFDNLKEASFFMSDDYWRKGQEIALRVKSDDDDDDYPRNAKNKPKLMSKSRVADFIDDPHQRILYIYDPEVRWTMQIELIKILADDPKTNYPKCTRSVGAAPKQYKQKIAPPPVDEEEEDDEEDKKRKEKVFAAEEGYDETENYGDSEEGEEGGGSMDSESEPGEEGDAEDAGEEQDSDFDPGAFASEEEF